MKKITKMFTLIELMIVVAIIAIIATIAVPQLLDAQRNSKEKGCIGTMRSFMTDQETYKTDGTVYGTIDQLRVSKKTNLLTGISVVAPAVAVATPKAGYNFTDLVAAPTADAYAVSGVPSTPGSTGKKVYSCSSSGNLRTSARVIAGYVTSNAAGATAVTAEAAANTGLLTAIGVDGMCGVIAPAQLQGGIDYVNLFAEAK